MLDFLGLPPNDVEYRIAFRLLSQDPAFDRAVLEALVGSPKRYRDLRILLEGRNDNVLTKALARLKDEGAIKQGLDLDTADRSYGLTELGRLVVFRMHEMVPHWESIRAYERGRAAESRMRRPDPPGGRPA